MPKSKSSTPKKSKKPLNKKHYTRTATSDIKRKVKKSTIQQIFANSVEVKDRVKSPSMLTTNPRHRFKGSESRELSVVQNCWLLNVQAQEIMKKYVCISVGTSYGDIKIDNIGWFSIPQDGIFGDGNLKQICNFKVKPVAIKILLPGHIMVAIWWPKAELLEIWNSASFEDDEFPTYITRLLPIVVQEKFNLKEVPKTIWTSDFPIQSAPKRTNQVPNNYCQTWIWFWVYVRTVLKCEAKPVMDKIKGMSYDQRTQLINDFWYQLSAGVEPKSTIFELNDVCIKHLIE
jgi:hypothetical protein